MFIDSCVIQLDETADDDQMLSFIHIDVNIKRLSKPNGLLIFVKLNKF